MSGFGILIAAEAETWIDTPFVWQGRIKARGCDCKGLVAGVFAALGRPEADSLDALAGDYGDVVDARRLRAGLARQFDRVFVPEPGDILLIRTGGTAQHLAIHAPRGGAGLRTIEAMVDGPCRVRPFRRHAGEVDSIWRARAIAEVGRG